MYSLHNHPSSNISTYNFFFSMYLFIYLFICLFAFSKAASMAYGDSQARGLIGAIATGLGHSHSNERSEPSCDLHHSSRQRRILNLLSKGRDRTRNLMVPSRIRSPLRHDGNSDFLFCRKVQLCCMLDSSYIIWYLSFSF